MKEPTCRLPGSTAVQTMAVALLAIVVYATSLANGFVYDDHYAILGNPWLTRPHGLADIFTNHLWGFDPTMGESNLYRPMVHVMNWLLLRLGNSSPWPFHLANILFHAAASALIAVALRHALTDFGETDGWHLNFLPVAAAALFAVHPAHVEAVAWIAGAADSYALAFLLLCLLCHRESSTTSRFAWLFRLGSPLAFALALLSKEVALVWPAVLFTYDYWWRRLPLSVFLQTAPRRYLPLVMVWVGYLALRISVLGGFAPHSYDIPLSTIAWTHAALQAAAWYVQRSILPLGYTFYAEFHLSAPEALSASAVSALVLLAAAGLWIVGALRSRLLAWLGIVFLLSLAPVFYNSAMMLSVADRYAYLPTLSTSTAAVWLLDRLFRRSKHRRAITLSLLGAALAAYSAVTVQRIGIFRNDLTFWSHTASQSPRNGLARVQLAEVLLGLGRFQEAAHEAATAVALGYHAPETFYTLGRAHRSLGQFSSARAAFERALLADPESVYAHSLLGETWLAAGDITRAVHHFSLAVRFSPGNAQAHHDLAAAWEAAGQLEDAAREYQTAASLAPDNPRFREDSARLLKRPKGHENSLR